MSVVLSDEERKKIQKIELDILMEIDRICRLNNIRYALAYGTLIGAVRHNGFIPWDDDIDIYMMREDYLKFREVCKTQLDAKFFYQSHETDNEYYYLFDKIRVNNTIFRETYLNNYDIHHGVFLDIFPLDNVPDVFLKRKFQYFKFHFYRNGLMSKYLDTNARHGIKKIASKVLKIAYASFSLEYLYQHAQSVSMEYNDKSNCSKVCSFSGFRNEVNNKEYYTELFEGDFEGVRVYLPKYYNELLSKMYGNYMELPPIEKRKTLHDVVEISL